MAGLLLALVLGLGVLVAGLLWPQRHALTFSQWWENAVGQDPAPVSVTAPNAVDIGFAQSMLLHHTQAIQMAMLVQGSPIEEVRQLAQSILINQTHEAGLMRGWLSAWNAPMAVGGAPMAWVEQVEQFKAIEDVQYASQCKANGGAMPGMASPAELEALRLAPGAAQQRLFLSLMKAHHEAALPMAGFAYRNGQSSLIKGFARTLIKEQAAEVAWMDKRLAQIRP